MRPQSVDQDVWLSWNRLIGKARKAFYQGVKAFNRGVLDCPYPSESFNNKEWNRGFSSSYTNNKGLVE